MPSPHVYEHIEADVWLPPVQYQPEMTPEQSLRHPLLSFLFPSSHASSTYLSESPHIDVHKVVPFAWLELQTNPDQAPLQVGLQP